LLKGPGKIVLSKSMAKSLFDVTGSDFSNVIGKIIQVDDPEVTVMVTGIAEDTPSNSHFHFDALCSSESFDGFRTNTYWTNINGAFTYFKLRPAASISSVDSIFPRFVKKYLAPDFEKYFKTSWKDFEKKGGSAFLRDQKLTDIHLRSDFRNESEPNGNIQLVYFFGGIGLLIILLASINFTNLTTARAATRAKEVGIRKTVGALKRKLASQFILESFLYTSLSAVIAIALVSIFLTSFNLLSGKGISLTKLVQPTLLIAIPIFICIVSLIASVHPVLLLTSYKPILAIKRQVSTSTKGLGFRKSLIVFQFFISMLLAISSLVVYRQVVFILNKPLGLNKENVIRVNNAYLLHKNTESFRNELLKNLGIVNASYSFRLPPDITEAYGISAIGSSPEDHLASMYEADYDHLSTLGLEMAKGRFFSRDYPSDSSAIIINEQAAAELGFEDFHGRKIWSRNFGVPDTFHVIGIIKDYHLQGVQSRIKPLVLTLPQSSNDNRRLAIRVANGDFKLTVGFIEETWKKFVPESAIDYSFLDEEFAAQYKAEQKTENILFVFTALALTISCLGLFGLTAFTAEQRKKEISIRKVMGASVNQILVLLSKDFFGLNVIAFLIALPMSWYAMNKWLEAFPYRVEFDFTFVIIAAGAVMVISMLTVAYQTVRASRSNPVDSLRNE
jgi:putative ABC transport system permease protein